MQAAGPNPCAAQLAKISAQTRAGGPIPSQPFALCADHSPQHNRTIMGGVCALNQLALDSWPSLLFCDLTNIHIHRLVAMLRTWSFDRPLRLYRRFPRFGRMSVSIPDGTGKLDAGVASAIPEREQTCRTIAMRAWARNSLCLAPSSSMTLILGVLSMRWHLAQLSTSISGQRRPDLESQPHGPCNYFEGRAAP